MEKDRNRERAIEEISRLIHRKGYRSRFSTGPRASHKLVDLESCLNGFSEAYDNGKYRDGRFEIETRLPYEPRIKCRFYMQYEKSKGFQISKLLVSNEKTNEKKSFDLSNSNQLPGSQQVYSLFPKQKPWDDIMKGRFRL